MDKLEPKCTSCKFHKTCASVCVSGAGPKEANIMIVLDYPNSYNDQHNSVAGGSEYDILYYVLDEIVEIPREDIYITYALKCCPDTDLITKAQLTKCRAHLAEEVIDVNPKVVIPMGDLALRTVTGKGNINKMRGKLQTAEFIGVTQTRKVNVLPTFSVENVNKLHSRLERWARDIDKARNIAYDIPTMTVPTKVTFCDTMEKIDQLIEYCEQVGVCCFDFETKKLDKLKGTFEKDFYATMLSISFQIGSSYVIPLEHKDSPFNDKAISMAVMSKLGERIFSNPKIRKIAHNLNFDKHVLRVYGINELRGRIDDTLLMHHLYDETEKHGLKYLVSVFLPEFSGYDDEIQGVDWADIPIKILAQYNGVDTDVTLRLCTFLESKLLEDERVYTIYRNLSMGVFRTLWEAEAEGMEIDVDFLLDSINKVKEILERKEEDLRKHEIVARYDKMVSRDMKKEALKEVQYKLDKYLKDEEKKYKERLDKRYKDLQEWENKYRDAKNFTERKADKVQKLQEWKAEQAKPKIRELNYRSNIRSLKDGSKVIYEGINFSSPDQLKSLLYTHPFGFCFDAIELSTAKDKIKELNDSTGFVDQLLVYRSIKKTLGTYLEGIHKRLDQENKIHTSFLIHGTVSGRLSSKNPNLQNLPNLAKLKDEDAIAAINMIKKSFKCPEGYVLVQGDYSQAELRVIAEFANEETMLAIYARDEDIHASGAAAMLQISIEEFYELTAKAKKSARTKAKARNFGLIYDMSIRGFMDYAKQQFGLVLTYQQAAEEHNAFFKMFPRLKDYHAEYIAKACQHGWVRTLFGRRRRTPNINHYDDYIRSMDERAAINSPIQGTAGEFTIFALALLRLRLDPRVKIVNTVHDSIILYIPEELLESTLKIMKETAENLPTKQYFRRELKKVKMKFDLEVTTESWKDLKEYQIN